MVVGVEELLAWWVERDSRWECRLLDAGGVSSDALSASVLIGVLPMDDGRGEDGADAVGGDTDGRSDGSDSGRFKAA